MEYLAIALITSVFINFYQSYKIACMGDNIDEKVVSISKLTDLNLKLKGELDQALKLVDRVKIKDDLKEECKENKIRL